MSNRPPARPFNAGLTLKEPALRFRKTHEGTRRAVAAPNPIEVHRTQPDLPAFNVVVDRVGDETNLSTPKQTMIKVEEVVLHCLSSLRMFVQKIDRQTNLSSPLRGARGCPCQQCRMQQTNRSNTSTTILLVFYLASSSSSAVELDLVGIQTSSLVSETLIGLEPRLSAI
jgi:hypothetical protein